MNTDNTRIWIIIAVIGGGIILLFLVIYILFAVFSLIPRGPIITTPTSTPAPVVSTSTPAPIVPISPTSLQPPMVDQINIFLISLQDNGRRGPVVGCGDSVVAVPRRISPTVAPLRAALEELLSIKTQIVDTSGLYNSLYQSDLRLDNVLIDTNGKAIVNLSGTIRLGGTCDTPRFEAQLKQTVLQFPTVKESSIFINSRPLEQIVSERG